MHHVAPLSNFATLVQMLNVNLYKFHLHLPAAILYFFGTRVHKQMILGRDTIISVLRAQKLLLLIVTVCPLFFHCNLYFLSSRS